MSNTGEGGWILLGCLHLLFGRIHVAVSRPSERECDLDGRVMYPCEFETLVMYTVLR